MTATPTPDPEARCCPFCGGTNIKPFGHGGGVRATCQPWSGDDGCFAQGPMKQGYPEALTAFTRPSHALAATSALLREARTWLRVLADDQELMEPPSAYTDLLTRIDRELAKEAL